MWCTWCLEKQDAPIREAAVSCTLGDWKKYQEKFTPATLKLLAGTKNHCEVGRILGVRRQTVYNWRNQTKEHKKTLFSLWKNMKMRGSELFTADKFYKHMERACRLAGIENFCPYSFRHKVGQEVRDQFGIEAASAILGHKQLNTTEIYAKKAAVLAQNVSELRALSAAGEEE